MNKIIVICLLFFSAATFSNVLALKKDEKEPSKRFSVSKSELLLKTAKQVSLNSLQVGSTQQKLNDCVKTARKADCDGDGAQSIAFGGGDCDDADPRRYPGNIEVSDPDDRDEDCDLSTFGQRDQDGDGFVDVSSKNTENGKVVSQGTDCDDVHRWVNPNVPEVCNGVDDNCDGWIDDGVQLVLYRDVDLDGFGDPKSQFAGCYSDLKAGVVANDSDCDDGNPKRNPIGGCKN